MMKLANTSNISFFSNFFFSFLGVFSSLPIFINIENLNIFLRKIINDGVFVSSSEITQSLGSIYLPIGFFTFSIFLFYLTLQVERKIKTLFIVSIFTLLVILIIKDIGILRALSFSLSLSYIFLSLLVLFLIKNDEKIFTNLKLFFKYYFLSLFFLLLSNIISGIVGELIQNSTYPALRFHHIFFYEIYQYYVSFNSVLIIIFYLCFFILLLNLNKEYNFFFFIIIFTNINSTLFLFEKNYNN